VNGDRLRFNLTLGLRIELKCLLESIDQRSGGAVVFWLIDKDEKRKSSRMVQKFEVVA
jgi:hypothetical protein